MDNFSFIPKTKDEGWFNKEEWVILSNTQRIQKIDRVSDLSNPSLTQNITFGDINIPIDHVDDYNDLMRKIQRDKKFEEMIMKMTIDRLGGGSPLDKYHVRWN